VPNVTVNGFQMFYQRRGAGTPLLLIHGYPLDHTIWGPVLPLLEASADLILPDLRGFGRTEAVRGEYAMSDLAADLVALLDSLGLEKTVIAGHSMGGYLALAFARAYPQRVMGLGLVASHALADSPEQVAARYAAADRVAKKGLGSLADSMPASLTSDPKLQANLKKIIERQSSIGAIGALKAMASRPDSTPILASFEFPVLVVIGLTDALIPLQRAYQIQKLVPHSRVVEMPGVGHMPMMEAPRITAEALKTLVQTPLV
jgi:3-oxoadipate enol-lactonase